MEQISQGESFWGTLGHWRCLSKFQIGQLLFILSVCCAPYFDDGIRKIVLVLALLCSSKQDRAISIIARWRGMTKMAGASLILFGVATVFIPLACGVDPFGERLSHVGRPLEIMLWVYGGFLFARDRFFFDNFSFFSALSCVFMVSVIFFERFTYGFERGIPVEWVLLRTSFETGITLCLFMPYLLLEAANHSRRLFLRAIFFLCVSLLFVDVFATYSLTCWIALAAAFFIFMTTSLMSGQKQRKFILCVLLFAVILPFFLFIHSDIFSTSIESKVVQFSEIDNDSYNFTSGRDKLWRNTLHYVAQRPLFGHGYADFRIRTLAQFDHAHSSFFQIAWALGYVGVFIFCVCLVSGMVTCLWRLISRKGDVSILLLSLLTIVIFTIGGLTEDMFYRRREIIIPFWVMMTFYLTPYMNDSLYEKRS